MSILLIAGIGLARAGLQIIGDNDSEIIELGSSSSLQSGAMSCLSMGNVNGAQSNLSFGGIICNEDSCLAVPFSGKISTISLTWRQSNGAVIDGNQGAFTLNLTVNGATQTSYYWPFVDNGYKDTFIDDSLAIPIEKYDNISVRYDRINGTYTVAFPSYCIIMERS